MLTNGVNVQPAGGSGRVMGEWLVGHWRVDVILKLSENVWVAWFKTSYNWEKVECQNCDRQAGIAGRHTHGSVKMGIESVNRICNYWMWSSTLTRKLTLVFWLWVAFPSVIPHAADCLAHLGQKPGSRALYNATATRAATGSQPIRGRGWDTLPANPVAPSSWANPI